MEFYIRADKLEVKRICFVVLTALTYEGTKTVSLLFDLFHKAHSDQFYYKRFAVSQNRKRFV